MTKIIIGLVGEMGSGKSTVATYIQEKYKASRYAFSGFLRTILEQLQILPTRVNLIDLFLILAQRFGEDVLAKPMKEVVNKDANEIVVVEGIRRPADISLLTELPGFYLVGITSAEKNRYERITHRSEKTDDQTKTYEEFLQDEQRPTEQLISSMVASAHFSVDNDGILDDTKKQIDNIIKKIKPN